MAAARRALRRPAARDRGRLTGTAASDGIVVHASCVVVRERGILIRGPSGAGKSTLARRLIAEGERAGRFARLVGDDRVVLSTSSGRVLARPVPAAAGLIEVRGLGICRVAREASCVVRLIVDLVLNGPERLPSLDELHDRLLDVRLPRIRADLLTASETVTWPFRVSDDTAVTEL